MKRNLFADYPDGDPKSLTCRACGRIRTFVSGARFCASCDGNALPKALDSKGRREP